MTNKYPAYIILRDAVAWLMDNWIFQDVLEVLNKKITGPVDDNLNCYYGYCTENDQKVEMDNVNKVSCTNTILHHWRKPEGVVLKTVG